MKFIKKVIKTLLKIFGLNITKTKKFSDEFPVVKAQREVVNMILSAKNFQ